MSDLIRRPAAIEKLNERAREMFSILPGFEYYLGALHDAAADLRNMPTIDAVPVVRCKDCRFYRFFDGTFGKGWMCFENNTARYGDDYCSRGERKDDE